jgi:hypothetical protein
MIKSLPIKKISKRNITATGAIDSATSLYVCSPTAAITLTLPALSSCSGALITIKNISAFQVTVDGSGSEKIDGETTFVLSQKYQSITIYNNLTGWIIL